MFDAKIPARIGRLGELAENLWWSWHEMPRRLFRSLDYALWRYSGHNPIKQLREVSTETLHNASRDPAFLKLYDAVMAEYDSAMNSSTTWFAHQHSGALDGTIAYFSMEYALHQSLPMYAGGLGVLAGDHCKEASDIGLPLVAIGFMYPQGYFHQHISADGWQQEVYRQLDFDEAPITRQLSPKGEMSLATVRMGAEELAIGVWLVKVGCTRLYLLDTNLPENPAHMRQLTARLYVADRELRLQQEVVLGVGGVKVLRSLGINPVVWHANEGHCAFMMIERAGELMMKGLPLSEAVKKVQATTVFTTHTPVQAGHDVFPMPTVMGYWSNHNDGVDYGALLDYGRQDSPSGPMLNMTALSLRMAEYRGAVSRLHGRVTRRMWHGLWPTIPEDRVPIGYVTNGVHVPSWLAEELWHLFSRYFHKNWMDNQDKPETWDKVLDIPDEELWDCHLQLKRKLITAVQERMRSRWLEDNIPWNQMAAMGSLLDPDALTITFARRFVEYKRPALLFTDPDRLSRIVTNQWRPVQFIFAGKTHPADFPSKHLLHQVVTLVSDRRYQGRTAFVEDYDIHMSRYLTQGADVWLNEPRRLQEASGTSGMKAALNGLLNLSVLDGWWYEGYNGANGWAVGADIGPPLAREEDAADAASLYALLEDEVVPLYYDRDRHGIPHGWVRMVKESIRTIAPVFSAQRMLKEYVEHMYFPAARQAPEPTRAKTD